MLAVPAMRTLRKTAPKPRVATGTGVAVGALAKTKLRPMVLSLNMAKVLVGLKAGNKVETLGFTDTNVD